MSGFRRTSTDSSVDSKREGSLPLSPSRSLKKEGSLPPPAKTVKVAEIATANVKVVTSRKETSPPKDPPKKSGIAAMAKKEKSPVLSPVSTKSTASPPKEATKKEKSPLKEPIIKRDTPLTKEGTTTKRVSPVKEKPKSVNIAIKKTGATQSTSRKDVETPDINRQKSFDKKEKMTSKRISSPKFESSDSSDSESEAERLLRELSERRERIEAAKKEKLRKVSQQQEEAKSSLDSKGRVNRFTVKNDQSEKTGLPPLETPSDTPDDMIPVKPPLIPKASMILDAEQPPTAKFATLPRGFKSKVIEKSKPTQEVI